MKETSEKKGRGWMVGGAKVGARESERMWRSLSGKQNFKKKIDGEEEQMERKNAENERV